METNKTALTELIERIDKLLINFPTDAGLKTSKEVAIELLTKEKEQIKKSYINGIMDQRNDTKSDAETYYLETYVSTIQSK